MEPGRRPRVLDGCAVLQELGMDEDLGLGAEVAVALAKQAIAAQVAILEAAGQTRVAECRGSA